MNKETLKKLKERAQGNGVKKELSNNICSKFRVIYNLYESATEQILGKRVSVYERDFSEMLKLLQPEHIKFTVKEHGFGLAFFITYKKGWFKEIQWYHVLGYSFFALRYDSALDKFTVEDLKLIVKDLDNVILKLKEAPKQFKDLI